MHLRRDPGARAARSQFLAARAMSDAAHWDAIYEGGVEGRSWHQTSATASLSLMDAAGIPAVASVIDIGGAASRLVDDLLARGHRDLTVLDISDTGLALSRSRLGARAAAVEWVVADLLTWQPTRMYAVWHDRAVGHFFTTDAERTAYASVLTAAVAPGGHAIIGGFAPDGPTHCSGLEVKRAGLAEFADLVGPAFDLVAEEREAHTTPSGATQSFQWTLWRRRG